VACPPAGRSYLQSSRPVSESNARSTLSIEAAVNTSPPAVATGPPKFGLPLPRRAGRKSRTRSCLKAPATISPRGTSQAVRPVNRSTAASVPHGGGLHGVPPGESSGARRIA
jgi:hypothetical protein